MGRTPHTAIDRRRLLRVAAAMAVAAMTQPLASCAVTGRPRFHDYPFKLGVASGDPVADGFVIWTRLAPDPIGGVPASAEAVPVRWEVADDRRMQRVVTSGTVLARPDRGHAVHVDVQGLAPDRPYWYRFMAGGEASMTGRSRTFPVVGAAKDRMRIAVASCQHFAQGYFNAYKHMLADDLDLVLHLGDYVYESTWGPKVRWHLPEPFTLADYRRLHALYKTDAQLQAAHAAYPWAVIWDDHEVDNDYAAGFGEQNEPVAEFLERRAAAYQAYYEHLPLRPSARPRGSDMRLYGSLTFGDLATFALLDTRQYRSDQACQGPEKFGGQMVYGCAERHDPARTMLGQHQERWLAGTLTRSANKWKVIAQTTLMARVDQSTDEQPDAAWSDGWDGYPAARQRLLDLIHDRGIANAVVLGGDMHQFWTTDLKRDFADPGSPTVATEFVGTSVTSSAWGWAEPFLEKNPHVRFHDWRHRGYVRAEITPTAWRTDFRAVDNVTDPEAGVSTLASFAVEAGRAGAIMA